MLWACRLRTTSISDAFLTLCRDIGVTRLMLMCNELADGPSFSVTEEGIFDYCFRTEERHGDSVIKLRLQEVDLSSSFLHRLIKVFAISIVSMVHRHTF